MKYFEFETNKLFSCDGNCKHNCCIGWEISIDKKSLSLYQGLKKRDNRFFDGCFNGKTFNLNSSLRCPFLDEDNLCYIIKNYGEKSLCKTCKTHPRFKNFFSGTTETGLGLYCEKAGSLILSSKKKMKLCLIKDDHKSTCLSPFEKKVFSFRKKALSIIQNRKLPLDNRIENLLNLCDININKNSFNDWLKIFGRLENLKVNDFCFKKIDTATCFSVTVPKFDLQFEQLLSYLAYRHLSRAIDFIDLRVRLAFIILSFKMINHLFSNSQKTFEDLVEICRFYTSEIECNDDNLFLLLNEIESLVSLL